MGSRDACAPLHAAWCFRDLEHYALGSRVEILLSLLLVMGTALKVP